MNIKGRAALVSLAVHSESSWEGQGSFAADEMEKFHFVSWSCRLEMRHGGRNAVGGASVTPSHFPLHPSNSSLLQVICKYNLRGGKPDLQISAHVRRGQMGASSLSVLALVGMAPTWSPNPGAGRPRASEPSSCWLQGHCRQHDILGRESAPQNYSKQLFSE